MLLQGSPAALMPGVSLRKFTELDGVRPNTSVEQQDNLQSFLHHLLLKFKYWQTRTPGACRRPAMGPAHTTTPHKNHTANSHSMRATLSNRTCDPPTLRHEAQPRKP